MSVEEREFWNALIDEVIEEDRDFLIMVGSEKRD